MKWDKGRIQTVGFSYLQNARQVFFCFFVFKVNFGQINFLMYLFYTDVTLMTTVKESIIICVKCLARYQSMNYTCYILLFSSVQFSSVAQFCPTLYDHMNCSTLGLPVHHHLPQFIQTYVHQVGDVILPSHPLLSPSPPAPNPSQHQSLFQ